MQVPGQVPPCASLFSLWTIEWLIEKPSDSVGCRERGKVCLRHRRCGQGQPWLGSKDDPRAGSKNLECRVWSLEQVLQGRGVGMSQWVIVSLFDITQSQWGSRYV